MYASASSTKKACLYSKPRPRDESAPSALLQRAMFALLISFLPAARSVSKLAKTRSEHRRLSHGLERRIHGSPRSTRLQAQSPIQVPSLDSSFPSVKTRSKKCEFSNCRTSGPWHRKGAQMLAVFRVELRMHLRENGFPVSSVRYPT